MGFFVGFDENAKLRILGGNQTEAGVSTICIQSFPRSSATLTLQGFHRDATWPPVA